jgi:hypothetical protein
VGLQGDGGQWWWHYDWRRGTVIERYPVYSVHQYALAPMALVELADAGGPDHGAAVSAGLKWLTERPETDAPLVVDDLGVVWRNVGRHEPHKAVRAARSVASAGGHGFRLAWLNLVFPPGAVERECRPFELGWQLYAWHRRDRAVGARGGRAIRSVVRPRDPALLGRLVNGASHPTAGQMAAGEPP